MRRLLPLLALVVAIVAILAAILFPVFAQAKLAAKKSVDLSNLKQTNLSTAIYAGDHDDLYPINTPRCLDGTWCWGGGWDLPWDLEGGQTDRDYELSRASWGNSVQPYLKNLDVLGSPVRTLVFPSVWAYQKLVWQRKPGSASYALNGLLEQWPTSAIDRPSQLISFSAPLGGLAMEGTAFTHPYLYCNEPDKPCVYTPAKPGCGPDRNGEWSGTWDWRQEGMRLRASFGNGSNFAYADGSAKFRRMAANVLGKTDYRTDPYSEYDRAGNAEYSWYDADYCHALLFRPDFDFQNWGNPVEGY